MRMARFSRAYRKMHIPDDPLFNESSISRPENATLPTNGDHKGASGFRVWKTRYATLAF